MTPMMSDLLHDQEILAVDAHLGAGPLAEQHAVAGLHVERLDLAVLVAGARADGDDLALLRLLLGGVRNDDAALRLLLRLDAADDDAVVQRTKLHQRPPGLIGRKGVLARPVISTASTTVLSWGHYAGPVLNASAPNSAQVPQGPWDWLALHLELRAVLTELGQEMGRSCEAPPR